jgi:5-methylcytosine-specific restriction endonuclease McrA
MAPPYQTHLFQEDQLEPRLAGTLPRRDDFEDDASWRRAYVSAWQKANPEKARAYKRKTHANNPAKYRAIARVRRHLKEWKSRPRGAAALERKRQAYEGKCAYCGSHIEPNDFTWDHAVPRSRGGTDDIGNLVPAHRSCNSKKGKRTPEEWLDNPIAPAETMAAPTGGGTA